MVEPTDESFVKGHVFYTDENRTEELNINLSTRNIDKPKHKRHLSSAFFHLAGQYDVDPENKQKLPNRFAEGSAKAKIGWFSSLFVAGVGMFIEAFIIITTGQMKLIWQDQFPECWILCTESQQKQFMFGAQETTDLFSFGDIVYGWI